ncbi:MAG: YhbD family protein [Candidatus Afipia apatlaquensis]|uniref:YhbD family protein n=1 Tax=Candidatus Afipia apatlaquensis TaxID=2712852 RepID=A0A7C9VI43_9BRAD|nr:YhbD family protein [Candidatus Afipia apatlaquensis]
MEEKLISKKELLELTGISYGQLYRWKRKNLIPEEWFIKKSAFTGQETFFPREKILDRVEKIKNMKDDASLDDLAQIFSPEVSDVKISYEKLVEKNIIMKNIIDIYRDFNSMIDLYSFNEILYMSVLEKFLLEGSISIEESKNVLQTLQDNYNKYAGRNCEILFVRKMGIGIAIILSVPNEVYFEKLSKIVMKISINETIEKLKLRIKELF